MPLHTRYNICPALTLLLQPQWWLQDVWHKHEVDIKFVILHSCQQFTLKRWHILWQRIKFIIIKLCIIYQEYLWKYCDYLCIYTVCGQLVVTLTQSPAIKLYEMPRLLGLMQLHRKRTILPEMAVLSSKYWYVTLGTTCWQKWPYNKLVSQAVRV
jgi:hypothetical protein